MNGTQIALSGLVATTPRQSEERTVFRLVTVNDEDGRSNWMTIYVSGQTADNVYASIDKGHRVLVYGRLQVVDWDNGEKTGTSVEIHADAIGHNLAHHTTEATRTYPTRRED